MTQPSTIYLYSPCVACGGACVGRPAPVPASTAPAPVYIPACWTPLAPSACASKDDASGHDFVHGPDVYSARIFCRRCGKVESCVP